MDKSFKAVFSPQKFIPFPSVSNGTEFKHQWQTNRPWVLSNMSHAAYLDEAEVLRLMRILGATNTFAYDHDGAQAFLAVWPDKAILAFRGSQPQENQPTAKITDLLEQVSSKLGFGFDPEWFKSLMDPNSFKLRINDVLADLKITKTPFDNETDVHRGFLAEIDKLWSASILPDLENHATGIPVWFTGHSLGAAMATLVGMRYPAEEVMTFGEPRVGQNIAQAFKSKRHTRYVNGDDPVTKVPPQDSFDYEHHGVEVKIRDSDEGTDFRFDHSIIYYSENLTSG
jgi:triacylglycerol lipase